MVCSPTGLLCPWDSPGKNTGVGCHSLLQGIFLIQESNLGLLHWRQILYHLSYRENPLLFWLKRNSVYFNGNKHYKVISYP